MGLSNDQRAMLRLLAQREEGYEDIAALMGLSVEEVRARVKEALGELQEEKGPAAEEQGAAAAGPVAEETVAPAQRPAPAAPSPRRPRPAPRVSMPRDRRRLVELIGGAVVALLIVLFATGAVDIGGGDSDSDSSATSASSGGGGVTAANSSKLTQAILEPVDGGDAKGRALFGRVGKNVVLQVQAENLEPTPQGQSYSVWLYRSPKLVLRVGAAKVGQSGELAAQFPIPVELLGFVANGAFDQIAVSLLSEAEYEAALAAAKKRKQLPGYLGEDTLRGKITGPAIKQQQQ